MLSALVRRSRRPPLRAIAELESPEQQKAYSIKPMSLASVVQGARILMAQGAEKRAASTPSDAVGEDPRWPAFLQQLQGRGYFTAAEGTPGASAVRAGRRRAVQDVA